MGIEMAKIIQSLFGTRFTYIVMKVFCTLNLKLWGIVYRVRIVHTVLQQEQNKKGGKVLRDKKSNNKKKKEGGQGSA